MPKKREGRARAVRQRRIYIFAYIFGGQFDPNLIIPFYNCIFYLSIQEKRGGFITPVTNEI